MYFLSFRFNHLCHMEYKYVLFSITNYISHQIVLYTHSKCRPHQKARRQARGRKKAQRLASTSYEYILDRAFTQVNYVMEVRLGVFMFYVVEHLHASNRPGFTHHTRILDTTRIGRGESLQREGRYVDVFERKR